MTQRSPTTHCTTLAAVAWMAAATVSAQAGEIRLYPTAVVNDGAVSLADVAALRGFDAATTEKLNRLTVAAAPKPGGTSSFGLEDVRRALDAAHVNLAEVALLGSARCTVTAPEAALPVAEPLRRKRPAVARARLHEPARGTATVRLISTKPHDDAAKPAASPERTDEAAGPTTMESVLRRYLDDSLRPLSGRAEVRFGAAHRAALALRTPDCRFAVHPRGDKTLGMVWLDVEVTRNASPAGEGGSKGGGTQIVPVLAEVTLLRPVVVATRVLNHGQEVGARDVRMETRPFKRVEDVGVTDLAAVVGMECRRAIHPGDMIAARDIRNKPLVQRNQLVTVWSREGGLVVQTAGRATQEAWLGDAIEIRSEGSQTKFFATVSGPGTVTAAAATEVAAK